MTALLETRGLTAYYRDFQALFGVDLMLGEGETIAIIGSNGAGKTTLMRSIAGVLNNPADGIRFEGRAIGDRLEVRLHPQQAIPGGSERAEISGWIGCMRIGWRDSSPGTRWRLRALASACSIGTTRFRATATRIIPS